MESPISVIVPAHNEEAVIATLLDALLPNGPDRSLDVVVVCNGCTDSTASVAARHPGRPRVFAVSAASKHEALVHGDQLARGFPRLYVDADVVLGAEDARKLAGAVSGEAPRVAAPGRRLDMSGSSKAVRMYHALWETLPAAGDGVYGRGVIAVNESGWQRLRDRPAVMADDTYVHLTFADDERRVVADAQSVVRVPQTVDDLVRRRARVLCANGALSRGRPALPSLPSTRMRDVLGTAVRRPRLLVTLPVFVTVTARVRLAARRQRRSDATAWLRDDSRRTSATRPRREGQAPSAALRSRS